MPQRGRLVYERFFGVLKPEGQHIAFSVTKSFVATIAAMMIVEGKFEERAPVWQCVPERMASGLGDATVRQLLDMTTGPKYSEGSTDPTAPIWEFARAAGFLPRPAGYAGAEDTHQYLRSLKKDYVDTGHRQVDFAPEWFQEADLADLAGRIES